MIRAQAADAPRMKMKAAEARYILPIAGHMLRNYFPVHSAHATMRLNCTQALEKCYKELELWGPGSSEVLGREGRTFMILYGQLSEEAAATDPRGLLWRLYPKLHLFLHVCEQGVSPTLTWNYADESAIGECARMAETCRPSSLGTTIIRKYRAFEFQRAAQG